MTADIAIMLVLIVGALVVFSRELLPIEVTAVTLVASLLILGIIDVDVAISGLSNKAVVTIAALFVLSHALSKTGFLEAATSYLGTRVGARRWLGISIMLIIVSVASAFLSNTAVVAMFIPMAIQLSQKFEISPSKVLMPVSYAAVFGGTLTLIGTSTNLIVNSFLIAEGAETFGMFEFARLGWLFLLLGIIYVVFAAPRILPSRAGLSSLMHKYHMGTYLTELMVADDSRLVGKSCLQVGLNLNYDITVLAIIREEQRITENIRNLVLEQDDTLIVRGEVDKIMRLRQEQGVQLLSDIKLDDSELSQEDQVLAEALIVQNSRLIGRTLRDIDFRRHYGAFVLAVRHHSAILRTKIAHIPMQVSDTLLMLAPKDRLNELRRSEDMIIISEVDSRLHRDRFWWLSVLIIPLLVIVVAMGLVDILTGVLVAVVFLLLTKVIDVQEMYRSVDWSVLLLIAAFVPVGYAMTITGTAQLIAAGIMRLAALAPPDLVPVCALALVYLATAALTQIVSNNATAIILAPIAISAANELGADIRPFLMAVAFASSSGLMTPISYQTNLMVYGPGSYRFGDYVRFGIAPTLLFWVIAVVFIPVIWPLF
ncbi:MAG: SLC13 family permease [Candidatus Marinimicrobia bacterium]|nr:SLC13 family permease [Candidatus Neomarinimicrobiota bacterium]